MDFDSSDFEKFRFNKSMELFKSLDLGDSVSSAVYLHVLNVIGAISCLSNKSKRSKLEVAEERLFWKTLGEISLLYADEDDAIENQLSEKNPAVGTILLSFPKTNDGTTWLPLHFALSLQTTDPEITQALLTAQPQRIHTQIVATNLRWLDYCQIYNDLDEDEENKPAINPFHLAFMRKEPCPGLFDQLYACDVNFASSKASDDSFPLHFAVRYSNSVDLIRRLVDQYPEALKIKNKSGETPLFALASNINPAAPEMLKFFLQAAPETVQMANGSGNLPLHFFAYSNGRISVSVKKLTVAILLDAYPEAANIANEEGQLPLHIAAENAHTEVLQIIAEGTKPANLMDLSFCGSASHCAVSDRSLGNLKYLHSLKPELLLHRYEGKTPLHKAIELLGSSGEGNCTFIKAVASLAPEALTMSDNCGNNLLHALVSHLFSGRDIVVEEIMRFLLRSIPGGAIATNDRGQTPFDVLNARNTWEEWNSHQEIIAIIWESEVNYKWVERYQALDSIYVLSRLLLLAGAPFLHPELRKKLNYRARKGALFAFFAERIWNQNSGSSNSNSSSSSSGPDIFYRICNGPGSFELMKQIVSFL